MEFDGISNGCSTIGIAKTPPIEILEQRFPVLFKEFAIAEDSADAGKHRGGFGVRYSVALACAVFLRAASTSADGWALTSLLLDVDPISRASRREAGLMVAGTKMNEGVSRNWY
jgi:hypothetical protein